MVIKKNSQRRHLHVSAKVGHPEITSEGPVVLPMFKRKVVIDGIVQRSSVSPPACSNDDPDRFSKRRFMTPSLSFILFLFASFQ